MSFLYPYITLTSCKTRQVWSGTRIVIFIAAILSIFQYLKVKKQANIFGLKIYLDRKICDTKTRQDKYTLKPGDLNLSKQLCQSINTVWNKYFGKTFFGQKHIWVEKRMKKLWRENVRKQ